MRNSLTILFLFCITTVAFGQSKITGPFDSEKWLSSSTYRYDLILRSTDVEGFDVYNKSEKEIIALLGQPFQRNERTNSSVRTSDGWVIGKTVIDLTYCLDLVSGPREDEGGHCTGASITYHFYQNKTVDATVISR